MATTQTEPEPKPKPLRTQLYESSEKFACLAMQDYLDGEMGSFFVHAGTALEQLSKAYLASIDPTLVADGRSFDSILHASGKGRHARIPANRMKTITIGEALDRCGQIVPAVKNLREDLRPLIDARNGAIHVGDVDDTEKVRMLVPYLRASRQLLGEGGYDEDQYWGEFKKVVDLRVAKQTEAAIARAQEAMTAALLRFQQKYGHLGEDVQPAVLRAIEESYSPAKYDEQLVGCPVCPTVGLAWGSTEVEWQADWDYADGESYIAGGYPEVTFFPGGFVCRACELELDGEEELAAAGIETSWELEDVDAADFYDDEYEEY